MRSSYPPALGSKMRQAFIGIYGESAGTSSAQETSESGRWQHWEAELGEKTGEQGAQASPAQSLCDLRLYPHGSSHSKPQWPLLADPPTLPLLPWSLGTDTCQPHGVVLKINTLMGGCVERPARYTKQGTGWYSWGRSPPGLAGPPCP